MKRLFRIGPAMAAAALLAACATTTPYQAATGPRAAGYDQQRIESDRWRVSFRGSGPHERIEDLALLRASELTLEQGYDWFQVVSRWHDGRAVGGSGPRFSIGLGGGNWGRSSGVGVGAGVSFGGGAGSTAREVTFEIRLGRGAKPDDPNAYDARAVQSGVRARL